MSKKNKNIAMIASTSLLALANGQAEATIEEWSINASSAHYNVTGTFDFNTAGTPSNPIFFNENITVATLVGNTTVFVNTASSASIISTGGYGYNTGGFRLLSTDYNTYGNSSQVNVNINGLLINAVSGVSIDPSINSYSYVSENTSTDTLNTSITNLGEVLNGTLTQISSGASVPEPTSIALLAAGIVGYGVSRRKKA
jgi:hypothetical protein